ncbi:MAG: hypothetical protein KA945_12100 [Zoogloea sp.]|jgi:hypothetical protein|nr:hypothetical protein [Zoogloea sp.]
MKMFASERLYAGVEMLMLMDGMLYPIRQTLYFSVEMLHPIRKHLLPGHEMLYLCAVQRLSRRGGFLS